MSEDRLTMRASHISAAAAVPHSQMGEVLIVAVNCHSFKLLGRKFEKYDLGKLDFLGWFCFTTLQM